MTSDENNKTRYRETKRKMQQDEKDIRQKLHKRCNQMKKM